MNPFMPNLDVVIPVRLPSKHLIDMRRHLVGISNDVRINYVLDCDALDEIETVTFSPSSTERVFSGKFGSPGETRNAALDYCDSEYICFWDVDDFPKLAESMHFLMELKNAKSDLGIGNWTYFDSPHKLKGISPQAVGMSPGIWRFIFKRDLIANIRFSPFMWGEDQLFLLNIFEKNPSVYLFPNSVYSYVKYVEGALTTKTENVEDLIRVNEIFFSQLGSIQGNARICFEIMNLKQIYSVFKYGQKRAAIQTFLNLLRARQKGNLRLRKLMYRAWSIREW